MAGQDWIDPQDFRILLLNARWMRGWSQRQLAAAAGVDRTTIDRYENGRVPPRQVAERIFAATGRSLAWLEIILLPGLRAARLGRPEAPPPPPTRDISSFTTALAHEIEAAWLHLEAGVPAEEGERPQDEGAERRTAEALWSTLAPCNSYERQVLVERLPAFQSWSMVERLGWESEREAANDADAALELAHLARRAAERMPPGPERERSCGYAWGYLGNALRVKNDHEGSCQAYARCWGQWKAGSAAELPLEEWRLWDLEASLFIDIRQLDLALENLRQALSQAPSEAKGILLLSRGNVWRVKGEHEKALADLDEAASCVNHSWVPRGAFGLQFNRADSLRRLDRFEEASRLLPEVRSRVNEIGNELDLVRTLWLEGTVAAGLGRLDEGRAALLQVEAEFRRRDMAFDGALVNLDIAEIELAQGETASVKQRAMGMWWIFRGKGVHREALVALQMFCEAARQEEATVELTRQVKAFLERARNRPERRFER